MSDSYISWCWIDLPDRECFTATVALNRITHVFCEALHPPEADTRIFAVRSGLAEGAWEEAWRMGRAMTLEETVFYTLAGEREAGG